ncbi:MAG: glycosyltransferase family 39 protein [Proteobacteria bacterium]|nr:glycosyltransferase family 39 protein [Pseudomonadota bacterium]
MNKDKVFRWIIGIIIALTAVRLLSLAWTPLTDTTEARYAEIGQTMAATGNYITPMMDNAPFWAKPPLSFWATALSDKIFGMNDFAAHLPHFLFLVGAAALLYFFVRRWRGEVAAAVAVATAMTMPTFLYLAGGVMTDPALAFCFTLCMVSFYNTINRPPTGAQKSAAGSPQGGSSSAKDSIRKDSVGLTTPPLGGVGKRKAFSGGGTIWSYTFFIGLGLGLLAKGPLIIVLVGLPIFIWTLVKNKWRDIWKNVPWITGTLLMLAIAAPWYLLAERATPGFLKYFIVGEHFERYITPHWAGDLYGEGRGGFIGKIWLLYILAAIPWSIWLVITLIKRKTSGFRLFGDDLSSYAMWFVLGPLIFFTFSRNIVPAYVLPSLIPTGILIAFAMGDKPNLRAFKTLLVINIAILVALIGVETIYPKWTADLGISDKYFISQYEKYAGADAQLVLYKTKNYSAEIYAAERGIHYDYDADGDIGPLMNYNNAFVLMKKSDLPDIPIGHLTIAAGKKMVLIKLIK